jgi:hypothetical protein
LQFLAVKNDAKKNVFSSRFEIVVTAIAKCATQDINALKNLEFIKGFLSGKLDLDQFSALLLHRTVVLIDNLSCESSCRRIQRASQTTLWFARFVGQVLGFDNTTRCTPNYCQYSLDNCIRRYVRT